MSSRVVVLKNLHIWTHVSVYQIKFKLTLIIYSERRLRNQVFITIFGLVMEFSGLLQSFADFLIWALHPNKIPMTRRTSS